jgi:hypothetical protein
MIGCLDSLIIVTARPWVLVDLLLLGGPPSLHGWLSVPYRFIVMVFWSKPLMRACIMLPVYWEVRFHSSCLYVAFVHWACCLSHVAFLRSVIAVLANLSDTVNDAHHKLLLVLDAADFIGSWLVLCSGKESLQKHDGWLKFNRCSTLVVLHGW